MKELEWVQTNHDSWTNNSTLFGLVTLECVDDGSGDEFEEWDIHFNNCWQGSFFCRHDAIEHLKACIKEVEDDN